MASKKKQEEENLKALREMVTLAHNKHCFDCNQRGPTYINMTIGSFICTSCSGLLRGLNPPHRVKSISMASFTSEEMEFIKSRGNDFCRKVWFGLHDGRSLPDTDLRDENKMRDLMSQKYEKKRWYVHPTDELYEEARRQNSSSASKQHGVKPISTLVGHNLPALNISSNQTAKPGTALSAPAPVQSIQRPTHGTVFPSAGALPSAVPSAPQSPTARQESNPPQKSASLDILADMGGDPFAGTAAAGAQFNSGGFADFSAFDSHQSTTSVAQKPAALPQPHPQPASGQPPWSNSSGAGAVPLQPFHAGARPAPAPTANTISNSAVDKYSALVELESVFSAMSGPLSVNWDGSAVGGMRGGVFGQPTMGQPQGHPTTGYGYGSSGMSSVPPPPSYASLGTTSVANPFGVSGSMPSQPVATATTVNPFASGAGVVGTGYGQPPVAASYGGQYRMPAASASAGAANVAVPPGGFVPFGGYMVQSAGVQNGVVSSGAMWGAMPPAQQSQVPQQTPGWGQPLQANPFGGMAPPRPSNVTNPFL